ncbi:MAG TPA: zinc metalloprotease HtpX [Candidatus Polarisedimenticolaceae bacterium]|nr:zinc metalloprotease HtpX [Candidatus Polarisedimenticolaceae bacterium]
MTGTNYLKTALLLGLLTGLILLFGQVLGGRSGMTLALGFAALMNFGSYWFSDKIVLAMHRARPVTAQEAPRLHAIVDRLVARAGLPKPRVYLLPEPAPNAFATGRNPQHSAVAVTAGLLELMSDEEVEGVVAHELAHVRNRDILISSIAATIAGAITWLAHIAQWGAMFGGYGGRDDREGQNPLALLLLAILSPIAALIIQMAISRSREYAADATGAQIAGQPYGLARALEKLGQYSQRIPLPTSPAARHLFIVAPLSGGGLSTLFSTHPPLEERIRRLLGR